MPVPASINDLSTTAASNSPGGGENPFPDLDNHIRALASFIAVLRDGKLDASTVSAFMLTVLNDADAATARATLGAVGTSGDQTIAGVKTFSSSPVAPTPTTGDNTTKVATTAFVKTTADSSAAASAAAVEAKVPGVGQTWQDVTSSRSLGTTYTNSTARPIYIVPSVIASATAAITLNVSVDGLAVNTVVFFANAGGYRQTAPTIVPAGSTYSVTSAATAGTANISSWFELR